MLAVTPCFLPGSWNSEPLALTLSLYFLLFSLEYDPIYLYPGFWWFHLFGGLQRDVIRNSHHCFFKVYREGKHSSMCLMTCVEMQAVRVSPQPLHGAQPFWVREQSVCNKWQILPRIKQRAGGEQRRSSTIARQVLRSDSTLPGNASGMHDQFGFRTEYSL